MKTSYALTMIAIPLVVLATSFGLFVPTVYQDNAFVQTAWQGNDWVTLLIVVPSLALVLWLVRKGSKKARLLWTGLLGYLVYNYAFYLFGAVYNPLFLVYVLIFTLSLFALITGLASLPTYHFFYRSRALGWIVAYLVMIVLVLGIVEIIPNIQYLISGDIPETIILTGHPTAVVYALDLSLVVPVSVLAIILLLRRQRWGYILTAMMLVKGATYGLVLMVNTMLLRFRGTGEDSLFPFYAFIMLGGAIGLYGLLSKLEIKRDNVGSRIQTDNCYEFSG